MNYDKWINISVICEGQTELNFITKKLNKNYFNSRFISLKPIAINKTGNKKSLEGNVSIDRLVTFIKRASETIVTTFVDFYGFKNKDAKSVDEIEQELSDKSNAKCFIPYLQLYEIEALWFSNIEIIKQVKNADSQQFEKLKNIQRDYPNPEDINDGIQTAPSKRLIKIFPNYSKLIDGNSIFEKISIDEMIVKCPRFAKWIKTIEEEVNKIRK
jgi:hypothetical protein